MASLTQDEWWAWVRAKAPDPSMPFRAVVFMKPGREETAIYLPGVRSCGGWCCARRALRCPRHCVPRLRRHVIAAVTDA
jgi:hypothetical protein